MVDELESKLLQALDKHAPEITKTVTVRHRLPWYTDKIKEQKRRIHRREGVWQKYKLESNWIALKRGDLGRKNKGIVEQMQRNSTLLSITLPIIIRIIPYQNPKVMKV